MAATVIGDVLLAVHGAGADGPTIGRAIADTLADVDRPLSDGRLLARLLELEASGHVHVERGVEHRFSLTPRGEEAAAELAGARTVAMTLVMVDLVGFVAFTAEHGDDLAHQACRRVTDAAAEVLAPVHGRVVKSTGDGFIGTAGPALDPVPVLRQIAARSTTATGEPWPMRAAAHRGAPIEHRGDLFGHDVNLLARLCAAAGPDELLVTGSADGGSGPVDGLELLPVRGVPQPVTIRRLALR